MVGLLNAQKREQNQEDTETEASDFQCIMCSHQILTLLLQSPHQKQCQKTPLASIRLFKAQGQHLKLLFLLWAFGKMFS